jgi:arylsulfatase K
MSSYTLSNRVEAWTRDVAFLLRQEGRPIINLIPDKNRRRVMTKDWQNTDKAIEWLRQVNYTKPFVLYLGLNLPHPYPSPSSGENFGSSTFHTSLYWLEKVKYSMCAQKQTLRYGKSPGISSFLLLLFSWKN